MDKTSSIFLRSSAVSFCWFYAVCFVVLLLTNVFSVQILINLSMITFILYIYIYIDILLFSSGYKAGSNYKKSNQLQLLSIIQFNYN